MSAASRSTQSDERWCRDDRHVAEALARPTAVSAAKAIVSVMSRSVERGLSQPYRGALANKRRPLLAGNAQPGSADGLRGLLAGPAALMIGSHIRLGASGRVRVGVGPQLLGDGVGLLLHQAGWPARVLRALVTLTFLERTSVGGRRRITVTHPRRLRAEPAAFRCSGWVGWGVFAVASAE